MPPVRLPLTDFKPKHIVSLPALKRNWNVIQLLDDLVSVYLLFGKTILCDSVCFFNSLPVHVDRDSQLSRLGNAKNLSVCR